MGNVSDEILFVYLARHFLLRQRKQCREIFQNENKSVFDSLRL
jgi:hypothetical protein